MYLSLCILDSSELFQYVITMSPCTCCLSLTVSHEGVFSLHNVSSVLIVFVSLSLAFLSAGADGSENFIINPVNMS